MSVNAAASLSQIVRLRQRMTEQVINPNLPAPVRAALSGAA
jgi:hypothetical protein